MKEKTFVELITQIKFESNRQTLFNEKLGIIFPDSQFFYFDRFEDRFIQILKDEFNDKDDWISWWVYETDFNRRKDLTAKHKNGKPIKLGTPEELYKFLVKNYESYKSNRTRQREKKTV